MGPKNRQPDNGKIEFNTDYHMGGDVVGDLIFANEALSFWGGVSPETGEVIDRHHPLSGHVLTGKILAIPGGRGSCTGSAVMLELLLKGTAPSGLILAQRDEILILGVMIAKMFFDISMPVAVIGVEDFKQLENFSHSAIMNDFVLAAHHEIDRSLIAPQIENSKMQIGLSNQDQKMLAGDFGKAKSMAMMVICKMAELQNAQELIDVTQVHIDGCIYTGEGGYRFAKMLRDAGGKVAVPTSMNSISLDMKRWQMQGVNEKEAKNSSALASAYTDMGAKPTYTCAPYLLPTAPQLGDNIGWAESNAVVFANSVLGAHTQKYPDFLDACIAIAGRAPKAGCHLDIGRIPTLLINVEKTDNIDDAFYPLLGYTIGDVVGHQIPLICGLEQYQPTRDNLKALSAAFATTSGAPMFHIEGITPEAKDNPQWKKMINKTINLNKFDLVKNWQSLNGFSPDEIDLIALGNPHFSFEEAQCLASLVAGRRKNPLVDFMVTMGRDVFANLKKSESYSVLRSFNINFVNDTCWCMITKPVIGKNVQTIMTNSGKYAHYGEGLTGCKMRFGSLADCVEAAIYGKISKKLPNWLGNN
ncbi:cis-3-hydroxy-L-proline dehydratase [Bartonella sp. HY761]|uniref:cis-3-hydroxy-L-proline dehydratase n=1 Tax=Bartonella sp. HY761 TaxID=2979330 RepID=UPI0022043CB5|nr:aconitase X [Bartonella sp. HY761]UXN07658.1 aconitase X [Bartonella sp. HY761]